MDFYRRIGQFLFLLGFFLVFLFIVTDIGQEPKYELFFWGLVGLIIGAIMIARNRPKPKESGRFRLLRNLRSRDKNEGEKEEE